MTSEIFFTQIIPKFAGSLLLAYLLTRFFRKQFVKTIAEKEAIIFSAFGSAFIIGIITYFTMGFAKGLIWYLPGVIFWFAYDMIKLAKKEGRIASVGATYHKRPYIFQLIIIALLLILIVLQFIDLPVIFRSCNPVGKDCTWHYLPMDRGSWAKFIRNGWGL